MKKGQQRQAVVTTVTKDHEEQANISELWAMYNDPEIEKYKNGQMLRKLKREYIVQLDMGGSIGKTQIVVPVSVSTTNTGVQLMNDISAISNNTRTFDSDAMATIHTCNTYNNNRN